MDQDEASGGGPVVVGVHPRQSTAVVAEAARFAAALGRPLLCAYVTEDSYLTEWDRAEIRQEASLHPDTVGADEESLALDLAASIAAALAGGQGDGDGVSEWSLRLLAGDPAKALARVAEEVDARLLVVGTHGRSFGSALEEWLAGAVATRLAHDQRRPVVVVPAARDTGRLLG